MIKFLYSLLYWLTLPIWIISAYRSALKRGTKQLRWAEKFGFIPFYNKDKLIWIHAVSVGEVMVIQPLIKALKLSLPEYKILVSTGTTTGQNTASELLGNEIDYLVYAPFDLPFAWKKAFQKSNPKIIIAAETELWLNFFAEAKRIGAKTMIVNGRISDRSFLHAKKLKFYYKLVLKYVDKLLMQTELDCIRAIELGADPAKTKAVGNLKFDQAFDGIIDNPKEVRKQLGIQNGPVIVAGSTRSNNAEETVEEELITEAFIMVRVHYPDCKLILAPRQLERSNIINKLFQHHGITPVLKTELKLNESYSVIILNTFGELKRIYAAADVAIVGGSFVNLGGQNPFQPLAQGKPVLFGPSMENFKDISMMAINAGAAFQVKSATELAENIFLLLSDDDRRREIGEVAKALIKNNLGASQRCVDEILDALKNK